jgi:hypothetical protein
MLVGLMKMLDERWDGGQKRQSKNAMCLAVARLSLGEITFKTLVATNRYRETFNTNCK